MIDTTSLLNILSYQFVIILLIVCFSAYFFFEFIQVAFPKSRRYAQLLSDMYVVGTIKALAKEDNIDLIKELQEYNKIEKKAGLRDKGLVSVIENELKEKVAEVQDKEKKETKK